MAAGPQCIAQQQNGPAVALSRHPQRQTQLHPCGINCPRTSSTAAQATCLLRECVHLPLQGLDVGLLPLHSVRQLQTARGRR